MLTDLAVHGMHNSRPSNSLRAGEPPAHEAPAILFGRTGRIVLNVLALVLPTDASAGAPPETLLDELLNRLEDTFKEVSAKLRGDAGKRPEPAAVS